MPQSWQAAPTFLALSIASTQPGCSCSTGVHHGGHTDTGTTGDIDSNVAPGEDGGVVADDASGPRPDDSGFARSCASDSADTEGCGCTVGEPPRACWPYTLDPIYRGVGLCVDGTQECAAGTEFGQWGPCTGEFAPDTEYCANMLDDNCDGTTDCGDPTCATDPACQVACTDGQTRDCYDGPPRTLGVGICHHGTQTCVGNAWPTTCEGEQLPEAEDCTMAEDCNCNRLAGCFDLIACATAPACQEHCTDPLTPGCVCPMGSGDVATCPQGTFAVTMGTIGGSFECCPCTSGDCGQANCCNESVCAGNAWCGSFTCHTLPPSCMGMVNADCDDFPEDCDEPCCECYGDRSGV